MGFTGAVPGHHEPTQVSCKCSASSLRTYMAARLVLSTLTKHGFPYSRSDDYEYMKPQRLNSGLL